jgi:hypothetical protein
MPCHSVNATVFCFFFFEFSVINTASFSRSQHFSISEESLSRRSKLLSVQILCDEFIKIIGNILG